MSSNMFKSETDEIVKALTVFLADTTIVYYKTHAFHWNVEGTNFYGLHLMFEKFYTELWNSMDEIAERIRTFGEGVPPNFADLLRHATILENETAPRSSQIMAQILHTDYLNLARKASELASLADLKEDFVTVDLITEKGAFLEKAAWMLQSTVKGE